MASHPQLHRTPYGGSKRRSLFRDTSGLSTVEYIIILVLIGVLAVALWKMFGSSVSGRIEASATGIDTMESGSGGSGSGASGSGASGAGGGGSVPAGSAGGSPGDNVTGEVAGAEPSAAGGSGADPSVMGEVIRGGAEGAAGGSIEDSDESGHVTTSVYVAPGTDEEAGFGVLEMIAGVGIVLAIGFPILIAVQKMRGSGAGS